MNRNVMITAAIIVVAISWALFLGMLAGVL
jgi:hypothetical protein